MMKTSTLVKVRVVLYTMSSLGVAWQTTMSGVDWSSMNWVAKSCLVAGIAVLWGQTMFAFFDKSAWKLDEERKNGIDKANKTPETKP